MSDHPTLTGSTFSPPIPIAQRWLKGVTFSADRPLLNVSQAAPAEAPPLVMRQAMAEALEDASTHLYGPDLGNPDLRATLADNWSAHYGSEVQANQVAITSGANNAFAATMSAICAIGDEVILPTPWYFNHKMWLDMAGITTLALKTGDDLLPDPAMARQLIGPRTKAIVLVTPNNPGGVEYPAKLIQEMFELAREHGIKLIIDETYRDFHSAEEAPHNLLKTPGWEKTLIQLYSFSKTFRLTGHRVGAIVSDSALMDEYEKFIDTVTICPSQLGQRAALFGLQEMAPWVAEQRAEILSRRAMIATLMPGLESKGWRLLGLGAYFAYVEHPFAMPAEEVAQKLVQTAGILALPGTMFTPTNDTSGERHLRIAFANIDADGIGSMFERLAQVDWPLAPRDSAA